MSANNSVNDYNSIFDYNTQKEVADSDNMNRDYLNGIYGENMSFLNKDIRLTRTQYYKRKQDIENSFDEEIKSYKKRMFIFSAASAVFGGFGIFSLYMSQNFQSLYIEAYEKIAYSKVAAGTVGDQQLADYIRLATAVFGTVATFCIAAAIVVFLFFNIGLFKHISGLKKRKKASLEHLEEIKKECMLLGIYDAIK